MNIKIGALILLLPVFFISGCDSGQDSPADDQTDTTETAPVEPATAPEQTNAPEAATGSVESEEPENEAGSVQAASSTGQQIYQNSCASCHKTGVANAPKLGDAAAWAPRIAKGKEALYSSSLNGVPGTAMVAKGGCGSCSEEDLKAAVDYMVSNVE